MIKLDLTQKKGDRWEDFQLRNRISELEHKLEQEKEPSDRVVLRHFLDVSKEKLFERTRLKKTARAS